MTPANADAGVQAVVQEMTSKVTEKKTMEPYVVDSSWEDLYGSLGLCS